MQNKIFPHQKIKSPPRHFRMSKELHIRIRKAKINDISVISGIEEQRFPNPWKENYLINELSHDISYFYVAEVISSNQVAGYIIFWIIEDELELHKIATALKYKKKSIGKKLFQFMLRTASQKKVKEIFLEVRKSNTGAIKFYESFDFQLAGVRPAYYMDPPEDALIYRLKFDSFLKR